ncbi:MAG: cytochrome c biogenesis protein CcsA [Phycisphaerae bacterium]|nr:cytochrome c biogenesis protein CcsA [Phycisphaerae bacterium]
MAELGNFALILGLFLAGYAVLIDILGAWRKDGGLIDSGRNATIASLGCLTVATLALWVLLISGDFSVSYVADHTSKALPLAYKISALWAGASGSLLFWLWLQVGFVVLAYCTFDVNKKVFAAGARAAANLVSVFFFLVLVLDKNPFTLSSVVPADGAGLNPLLQHPAMALHPPTLFIGYAALAISYAWALASLKGHGGAEGPELYKQARNWILWAWLFLTVGIALGSWWAYEELGWGGYWAWDPVENSSLMPWLIATALLHCSRTYKRNSSTAIWMMILAIVTFSLCIFGTFLTRYGLVSSVHAFPEPGLGILFLVLLVHIWVIAAVLLWRSYKRGDINSVKGGKNFRFIIYNNWLMILLTLVIFVGSMFPFFSSLFTEQKITLKPEYFTKITAPGGLALLLLLCVCPYLLRYGIKKSWRTIGAVIAATAALAIWFFMGSLPAAFFILCGFAILNYAGDFINRYIQNRSRDSKSAPPLNLRWYGARIVHIGVVLAFVGIAGSGGYGTEELAALRPGEELSVAGFDLVYEGLDAKHGPNFTAVTAKISVYESVDPNTPNTTSDTQGRKLLARLGPAKAVYSASGKAVSEVDIRRTLREDLYLALTEVDAGSKLINLRVMVKPLINWIWIGSIVMLLGTAVVLISFYKRRITV